MKQLIEQSGFQYFLDGMRMLSHPKIRSFVIVPLSINIVVFTLLSWLAGHYFEQLLTHMLSFLPSVLHWLSGVFWILFAMADLVVMAYCFTFVANLIAAPFNSLLARRVEALLTNNVTPQQDNFWTTLVEVPKDIGRAIQWLLYYLPRAIIGLILFIIPGVNAGAPVIWFLINAWTMSLQYSDYPADNNRYSFKQMRNISNQHRIQYLGFGSAILLFTMIPIVNFVVMPAAVIGATKLWLAEQNC